MSENPCGVRAVRHVRHSTAADRTAARGARTHRHKRTHAILCVCEYDARRRRVARGMEVNREKNPTTGGRRRHRHQRAPPGNGERSRGSECLRVAYVTAGVWSMADHVRKKKYFWAKNRRYACTDARINYDNFTNDIIRTPVIVTCAGGPTNPRNTRSNTRHDTVCVIIAKKATERYLFASFVARSLIGDHNHITR